MWRNANPCALLVGMQSGAATVESSMERPQKIKNLTALWPSDSTSGNMYKKSKTLIQKNICIFMLIAALFTIAQIWKQPKYPSKDEWIQKLLYIYSME